MNRRGFFRTLAAATAGFAILPPAKTYERIWKATRIDAFDPVAYAGRWKFISCGSPGEVELMVPCSEFKEQWLNDFVTAIKPTRLTLI